MKSNYGLFEPKESYKILLVDDDEDDFYIFNLAFSSMIGSFDVLRTSDGIMLSTLLESPEKFDAIFLDINMPYKNGISSLKEIRNMSGLASTRVVMYSTSSSIKDIDACYALGANFYLIKPSSYEKGVEQMASLLNNRYFICNEIPPRPMFVFNANLESQANGERWIAQELACL